MMPKPRLANLLNTLRLLEMLELVLLVQRVKLDMLVTTLSAFWHAPTTLTSVKTEPPANLILALNSRNLERQVNVKDARSGRMPLPEQEQLHQHKQQLTPQIRLLPSKVLDNLPLGQELLPVPCSLPTVLLTPAPAPSP